MTYSFRTNALGLSASFLLVAGCVHATKATDSNRALVRIGQSPSQLEALLGAPKTTQRRDDRLIWRYELFSDDSSRLYPYVAVFINGRLERFEFDTNNSIEDTNLREKRRKADQFIFFPGAGPDGSAPIND